MIDSWATFERHEKAIVELVFRDGIFLFLLEVVSAWSICLSDIFRSSRARRCQFPRPTFHLYFDCLERSFGGFLVLRDLELEAGI